MIGWVFLRWAVAASLLMTVCMPAGTLAATAISSAGSYGAGVYYLSADISVSSGDALTFTGTATLDLNGHRVSTSQTGNTWDHGVTMQGADSSIYDSIGGGKVTGFRVGAKFEGAGSDSTGIDYSGNRYMGVWIRADNVMISGGEISDIGGVTDEKYAIGVQVGTSDGVVVDGTLFQSVAPQSGYTGTVAGEGLAVNLSASSSNGTVKNMTINNPVFEQSVIGIFVGSGGGHTVQDIIMHNIKTPLGIASVGAASSISNVTATYRMSPRPR